MISGRRLAGPAPAARIPSTPGREAGCPTRIWRRDARESVNDTGAGRPNARKWAFVQNAAGEIPRPGAASANPASIGDANPSKPDTQGENSREPRMAGAVPRAVGAWRVRGRESAGASAPKPGYAYAAASLLRWRASSARPAGKRGALKSESSTPPGERKGDAVVAEAPLSARLRRALRAPQGIQSAARERTPRAGRGIATGGPAESAWTVQPIHTELRGVSVALHAHTTPPASTGECRSFRRASPLSNWPRASSTDRWTPGRRWRCASPSRNSHAMRSRWWKISP